MPFNHAVPTRSAHRIVRTALLVAATALLAPAAAQAEGYDDGYGYDELPEGAPEEIGRLYYSTLEIPGVAEWEEKARRDLLDVVTERYKSRLVDRAPAASRDRLQGYVARLAESDLARENPDVVRQTCAQFGLADGACAAHRGYVRRALVVEEMLVQNLISLDDVEVELVGATRPKITEGRAAGP